MYRYKSRGLFVRTKLEIFQSGVFYKPFLYNSCTRLLLYFVRESRFLVKKQSKALCLYYLFLYFKKSQPCPFLVCTRIALVVPLPLISLAALTKPSFVRGAEDISFVQARQTKCKSRSCFARTRKAFNRIDKS